MKHVLVLNQFALPRSQSGGTRHIDLFGRLDGWTSKIVAGNKNYTTQETYSSDDHRLTLVPVPRYSNAGVVRMLGWGLYALEAAAVGLTRREVDVVYASTPHLLSPIAGAMVARLRRVPLIVEVRDLWPESIVGAGALRRGSRVHRVLERLEQHIYDRADHVVAVTPGWESYLAARGVHADRLTVIPNGTEPSDFIVTEDRDALRREFGLTGQTAVYAGAHGPANALHLIVDAARELPDLTVLLVGAGSEKARLRELAADVPNLRFMDPVPKPQLARLLAAADIGIHCIEPLPILATGMSPNKLFDYLAAGLPVVSNAGEGLRTVMVDGECGHTGGPHSLARSLDLVMRADADTRRRWIDRGKSLAERHSRGSAAVELGTVLDELTISAPISPSTLHEPVDVVHLTTAHTSTDNRIFRKEVTALHESGLRVALLAVHPEDEIVDGVPIKALPRRRGRLQRMLLGQVDAYRALRRVRPEVLHIHDPELIPLGALWKVRTGASVIFDAHEDLPKQVLGKPYLPRWSRSAVARFARGIELLADHRFDAIVAATPAIGRNFRNARTTLVQNFPWLRDFPEPSPYDEASTNSFSYVGGLSRERGSVEMLEATRRAGQDAELTIAGPVTPEVEADLGSAPHTRYLGRLPVSQVPAVIASAQIGYVLFHPLPNHLECQPTKLFEYMAAGRPFVASDFAFWRSLFDDYGCGTFVDPTDVEAIASASKKLIDNPAQAAEMGRRGRRAVEEVFNFEGQAVALEALTRQVLTR